MQLGRVTGRVVCTVKSEPLTGKTLLLIQPLDKHGKDSGKPLVAIDAVGAGAGETVYWCRGKEAAMPWIASQEVPTEATVVGIVDKVHLG